MKVCQECEDLFEPGRDTKGKFCSTKCYNKHQAIGKNACRVGRLNQTNQVSLVSLETALNKIEKENYTISNERFTIGFNDYIPEPIRLEGLALVKGFKDYRRRLNECNLKNKC